MSRYGLPPELLELLFPASLAAHTRRAASATLWTIRKIGHREDQRFAKRREAFVTGGIPFYGSSSGANVSGWAAKMPRKQG